MLEKIMRVEPSHEEKALVARNAAQVELAEAAGMHLGEWIDSYVRLFAKTLEEHPTIIDDLIDEKTHEDTITELKNKLYH